MKILLITTTYPTPARPRQGAFNRVLAHALSARHEVRLVAPVPWTQALRSSATVSPGLPALHPVYYYPPKILRAHYHRFYWWSILPSIRRLEREFLPDVVMAYWLHPDGAAAVRAAARLGVPVVVMSGGTDLRLLTRSLRRREVIAQVLENADRVVVFSRELAGQAHQLGVPPDKVDVVYRGVDRSCFRAADRAGARDALNLPRDAVVLLWAGRFEPVKNPGLLLQAAVHWKSQWGERLRVILAGDGPLLSRLRQLSTQLSLRDVVQFAGNLTQDELALRFNAADLTVLTSHSEGIPNVLLESIACGTRFVATDVGGIAEIASPGIDRLVPAGDVDALAAAVIQQLGTAATSRRTFVPTDLAGMADQLDAVIAHTGSCSTVPAPKSPLGPERVPHAVTVQHYLEGFTR